MGRLFFLFVLVSCSSSAPEIMRTDVMRVFVADQGGIREYLSVFADVFDADGRDEIAELTLFQDQMELEWNVPFDMWERRESTDEYWIGYSRLSMPGAAPFPSGQYRIVVRDLSESEAEYSFSLYDGDAQSRTFPRLEEIDGETVFFVPDGETYLVCDRRGGEKPLRYRVDGGPLTESDRAVIAGGGCELATVFGDEVMITPISLNL